MKSYISLEQSKQLAEFLPIESADMRYAPFGDTHPWFWDGHLLENGAIPCWSLTALLNILPYPQLSEDKLGSGKDGWAVSTYPNNCRYDSCWHDNPVDACVEMIIKLHEQNIL